MSNKKDILENIRRHIKVQYEMPDIDIQGVQYADKTAQFIEISKSVGGDAVILDGQNDINELIRSLYPEAGTIASNIPDISLATIDPDDARSPYALNGIDLAVIQGELGVAENGCVWIPQNVKEKVIYFIAEYLVIVLGRNDIVNNMHEAYNQLKFNDYGFGVFISGPSKTADIEQALVVGAHGAKGVTVILR